MYFHNKQHAKLNTLFSQTKVMACCLAGLPSYIWDFTFLWNKSARMWKYSYESVILPDNYSLKRFIHLTKIQGVYIVGENIPTPKQNAFLNHKKMVKNNVNWVYIRCTVILSPYNLSSIQNNGQRKIVPEYRLVCFMQVMLVYSWHAFPSALQHHCSSHWP